MCGIFGITLKKDNRLSSSGIKAMISELFLLSESRGKEASGIAIKLNKSITVLKEPMSASKLLKTTKFNNQFLQSFEAGTSIIGHARLVTNGSINDNNNNQPVIKDGIVGIHNGIITNNQLLWKKYPQIHQKSEVDTEVLLSLIKYLYQQTRSIKSAIRDSFKLIEGSASISLLFENLDIQILATNTGSLYFTSSNNIFVYASEKFILEKFINKFTFNFNPIKQVKPNKGLVINLISFKTSHFATNSDRYLIEKYPNKQASITDISKTNPAPKIITNHLSKRQLQEFNNFFCKTQKTISKLKRCTRCILPETMPFIRFDHNGICNYCHNYQKIQTKGIKELEKIITPYRTNNDKPNCIVSFSGGRDSSYALHYVKNVLKLNPIAYSYDWGMLTNLGRRNQARMCGKLGIEHILVSADIQKKREYIQKNVTAWLKKPDLGMIPLFMAGDKQYFYYLNKLRKDMGISLVIYGDNALEKTDFKYGFANVELTPEVGKAYNIGKVNSAKLAFYYAHSFLSNPSYINSSLYDTFTAYISSYLVPKDYVYLFRYILWKEDEISSTLINKYNWETATDTTSTWRIGDGTASFYNYIYYTMAGFTENDTFKSNMIREGLLARQEALRKIQVENTPRWQSIQWYCNTVGINMKKTIDIINHAPRKF